MLRLSKPSVDALPDFLRQNWPAIRDQLEAGQYCPQPVRRVRIPKADGRERLTAPTSRPPAEIRQPPDKQGSHTGIRSQYAFSRFCNPAPAPLAPRAWIRHIEPQGAHMHQNGTVPTQEGAPMGASTLSNPPTRHASRHRTPGNLPVKALHHIRRDYPISNIQSLCSSTEYPNRMTHIY